jgi:hypothetical protein
MHFYCPQARLLPANYKIFEVPVLVFARAFGNARQRSVSREALGSRMQVHKNLEESLSLL